MYANEKKARDWIIWDRLVTLYDKSEHLKKNCTDKK